MEAVFAGGCFWCITPFFKKTGGVSKIIAGFSGGEEEAPSYEDVKYQRTGHREAIKLIYDDTKVDYETLLNIYLDGVDPFDEGGQFIDRGFSYTCAIYYQNDEQKVLAEKAIREIEEKAGRKCFIAIEPFHAFWEAEEYHQNYSDKNPEAFAEEWEKSGRLERFGELKKL